MLAIFLAVTLLTPTYAWYTCEELDFCTNIRNNADATLTYSLANIEVEDRVSGNIINDQTSESFTFAFVALAGDTFRFTVQNEDSSRYTPESDALGGAPVEESFTLISSSDEVIVLSAGDDLVVNLYTSPFQIEVLRDDLVTIEVNKANRLIINDGEDDPSLALDISFPLAKTAYGIPQHAERLSLPSTGPGVATSFRMFNVDNWAYSLFTREPLYGAVPVLYGVGTAVTAGLFWMNSAQTFVDITNEGDGVDSLFISESGALELFLLAGPTLRESVRQYTGLTGVGALPQYLFLGYHQCRYSYLSQEDVETVVAEMDNHNFPMDVIWLDNYYTPDSMYFRWNYTNFPNPVEMQNNVAATGRKLVCISDPHIKISEDYFVYTQGLERGFFAMNPNGTVYEGECWPGLSSYVDYFNPEAQEWYGDLHLPENFVDSTLYLYFWNDMNEPSVFEVDEKTFPLDVVHYGDIPHRDIHNMYGMKQTQATHAGLLKRDPTTRPFILTRAHFAGSQRYAAVWTGDNTPTWEDLQVSIPMVLSESLGGIAFVGADIGGFSDNVGEVLLQRWYQVGAWHPFYRGHSGDNTERREPYLFSEEAQERIRRALNIRYYHIPYWYTLFYEHELTGDPIVRPLSYHYPQDENVLDIDEQWLIGSDIMASPVLREDATIVTTYFPGDSNDYWINIESSRAYFAPQIYEIAVDMDSNLYYYRSGSIIFRIDQDVRSTSEQVGADYHAYILLDRNAEAYGNLYLDDFESFDYRNDVHNYYRFSYSEEGLTVENLHPDAVYDGEFNISTFTLIIVEESSANLIPQVQSTVYNTKFSIKNVKSKKTFRLT